jgi:hypothetical protein
LIFCVWATGQQALTQQQIRQMNKVRKNLAHYGTGTKLDVQLGNGSHKIGTLNQIGSTSLVLIDPASSKSEAIDYLDVKRVKPTRKEYMSQQLGKAVNGLPKVLGITLLVVAAIAVLVLVGK